MGKKDKKHDRNDKYYLMAKEQGYRARSAFKLIQINQKYGFLQKSRRCIDLCAAPGGWCQVAVKYMPLGSQVIGLDLLPIRKIRGVTTFDEEHGGDITSQKCRTVLKREMNNKKADCIVCDGAPNVGGAYAKDAYVQNELVLCALRLTTEHLRKKGVFVSEGFVCETCGGRVEGEVLPHHVSSHPFNPHHPPKQSTGHQGFPFARLQLLALGAQTVF